MENISANKTLSPGKVYKLSGIIYVINGASYLMTIGVTNLNPFYTIALAMQCSIDNLFPCDILSIKGAMIDANYDQWSSGWINFIPQTHHD